MGLSLRAGSSHIFERGEKIGIGLLCPHNCELAGNCLGKILDEGNRTIKFWYAVTQWIMSQS